MVSHEILLNIIYIFFANIINLVGSYLMGQVQKVFINEKLANERNVAHGVPQVGSQTLYCWDNKTVLIPY